MNRKKKSPPASGVTESRALTFPGELLHPPKAQLVQYEDALNHRVALLDEKANTFGTFFGVPMRDYEIDPLEKPTGEDGAAALWVLARMSLDREYFTLERAQNGVWGVYYTKKPGMFNQAAGVIGPLPIRQASLDVRKKFLEKSEAFFREYLKRCNARFVDLKGTIAAGDRTLELLSQVKLE